MIKLKTTLLSLVLLAGACKPGEPTPEEILQMGKWRIDNVNEISKYFNNRNIKDSYMLFNEDGSLFTQVGTDKPETGTWRLSDDKEFLHVTKDSGVYVGADSMPIIFDDQRTIIIRNNGIDMVFKRL